jgi:PIN domain nuclease of toxin-antitoxin system
VALAVADSHAVIWFAIGPQRKLGRRAKEFFARAEKGAAAIYIPTIVLLEVSREFRRGTVGAPGGFSQWVSGLFAKSSFIAVDLTVDIVLAAEALYAIPERADRLIAATASHLDCPLITRDPAIGSIADIETIW